MVTNKYPSVKIPTIISKFLEKQQVASRQLSYQPSRKKAINQWWGIPIGGGVVLFYHLLTLQWDAIALVVFLIALIGSVISAFFLLSFLGVTEKGTPPEDKKSRAIKLTNSLKNRYAKRPLKDKLRKVLKGKVKPLDSLTPSATQGVSEDYFMAILEQYFGDAINFPDGVFGIPGDFKNYTPDMVYSDSYTGLMIDIEIDEPYAGKTKEPHHCTDEGRDSRRDDFFLERNWVVVRFAEEQVVKNPLGCAYYLDKVIKGLNGISHNVPPTVLEPIPMWDSKMAEQMASQQHREIYLEHYGIFKQRS